MKQLSLTSWIALIGAGVLGGCEGCEKPIVALEQIDPNPARLTIGEERTLRVTGRVLGGGSEDVSSECEMQIDGSPGEIDGADDALVVEQRGPLTMAGLAGGVADFIVNCQTQGATAWAIVDSGEPKLVISVDAEPGDQRIGIWDWHTPTSGEPLAWITEEDAGLAPIESLQNGPQMLAVAGPKLFASYGYGRNVIVVFELRADEADRTRFAGAVKVHEIHLETEPRAMAVTSDAIYLLSSDEDGLFVSVHAHDGTTPERTFRLGEMGGNVDDIAVWRDQLVVAFTKPAGGTTLADGDVGHVMVYPLATPDGSEASPVQSFRLTTGVPGGWTKQLRSIAMDVDGGRDILFATGVDGVFSYALEYGAAAQELELTPIRTLDVPTWGIAIDHGAIYLPEIGHQRVWMYGRRATTENKLELASYGPEVDPGHFTATDVIAIANDLVLESCESGAIDPGEECDGSDLGGADCGSLGFDGGTLGCTLCRYDTSACVEACGNGVLDAGEACDGAELGGEDCASQGFTAGTLGCSADCTGFDTAECTSAGGLMFVAHQPAVPGDPGQINVFEATADGDVAPLRTIAGPSTGLQGYPQQLALGPHGLVVVDRAGAEAAILTFALDATGDTAPTFAIRGPATGLGTPQGVVIMDDPNDTPDLGTLIFVADYNASIRVFPVDADGDEAPIRVIQGPQTLLAGANQMWTDGVELLVAVPFGPPRVIGFPIGAGGVAGTPETNVAPTRNLSGAATILCFPRGIAVDPSAAAGPELFIADGCGKVMVYDLAAATGNTAPLRTFSGSATGFDQPAGLWLGGGELYVVSEETGSVGVFNPADGDNADPLRVLDGPSTGLSFPKGVIVTAR